MTNSLRKNVDMVNGPLFKNIWIYTVPVIMTGILQLLFNAADLVVVGRFCGSVCVAAVGATGAIINLVVNLFIGLSVGVGVTVATALGAKDDAKVSESIHTAMPVGLIGGIVLAVLGLFITYPLLSLMETPEDVIDLSATYMKIYFCGMPGSLLYNYGAAVLRADGDTKRPLTYLTIAGVVNVLLNLFFVIVIGFDVAGVALATIISQLVSATLVLLALARRKDSCRFEPVKMRIKKDPLVNIVRIGLPAGIQGSLFSISNVIIQSSVNSFGSAVMAGNSAASNIGGFIYTAQNSFSQTALNFTGQNMGAGNMDRVRRITRFCLIDVIIVGLAFGIAANIFARELLGIYLTDSPASVEIGVVKMLYVCLPYFICGMQEVMTGIIRGLGHSLTPMVVCICGACGFRVAWIFAVFNREQFHSLKVLYSSYPISWILVFATLWICYRSIYNKKLEKKREASL
ncbi:MAG: MATE family efflux transporter [Clostridia bacterium]|nr:MATE family efflux transporter [Clostridia bacterium]